MPLMPKRVKHRKVQRGSRAGLAQTNTELSQGDYGLKTLERGWITAIQIEACRVCIRIFPDKPVSKKPIGVRMGKGKGDPEFWVSVVAPGTMLFELAGVPDSLARESFRLAANKLGVRTRMVSRNAQV